METLLDPLDPQPLLAGRRLVRRLGTGRRWSAYSTVLRDDGLAPDGMSGPGRPALAADAVLLRARADAAERGLWRRAAVLSRLDHPHILRLLDVAEDASGLPCLLVERLSGGTLAELLRRRETMAPGEAVTILAPIVDAVRAAHLVGIAHGDVTPMAVVFAADGRPVLSGWSEARTVEGAVRRGGGTLPGQPEFVADWVGVGRLVDNVLRATSVGESTAVSDWIAEAAPGLADHELSNRLQQRIHGLARPLPVLLDREADPPISAAAAVRSSADAGQRPQIPTTRRAAAAERRQRGTGRRGRARTRGRRPDDHRLGGATTTTAIPEGTTRYTVLARRPRLLLGAIGACAVLVVGTMILLPSERAETLPEPASFIEPPRPEQTNGSANEAAPYDPAPTEAVLEPESAPDVVLGADPIPAAIELSARRERCRGEQASTSDCILDYAEQGSAFHDTESTGPTLGPIDTTGLELIDRQGDAAVLRGLTLAIDGAGGDEERQPVTLLMVRGETGWRLREIFTAG